MTPLPAELVGLLDRLSLYVINPILYLLMVIATALFLWGAARFILNADNPQERERGRKHLVWGLVGLFVMTSVYFILRVALATFGVQKEKDFPKEIPL
ncbi:MAG: hypothetical protein KatS3mg100_601 [Candidatus Parcubacteria bacterium]|nr:MAG: hypothetical protein KatS3mg100_601 [Candidatus Parcubacteria bacterium]